MSSKQGDTITEKLCHACSEEFSKDGFSKKQWLGSITKKRRCKHCVDSNREIVVIVDTNSKTTTTQVGGKKSNNNKKKKKRNVPTYAGNQTEGCYKLSNGGGDHGNGFVCKLASNICAWCGKVEEQELLKECVSCRNILYCSDICYKLGYPEHKLVCEGMKQDRKQSKSERKAQRKAAATGGGRNNLSEASGTGHINLTSFNVGTGSIYCMLYSGELRGNDVGNYESPGSYFASDEACNAIENLLGVGFPKWCQMLEEQTQQAIGSLKRTECFTNIKELTPIDQFLLSCGCMDNIERAKVILPHVLYQISVSGVKPDGTIPNIGDIKVRGYGLNALEWSARRGHIQIAEWLATDPRTRIMLTRSDSAPVAWACYTGRVELAKMLVRHGADSHATTDVVFGRKPPLHLASENGQLLAVKFLVEECDHDVFELDTVGNDMRASLRVNNKAWTKTAGTVACDDYAKKKGVEGDINRKSRRTKTKKPEENTKKKNQQDATEILAKALTQLKLVGGREEEPADDTDEDNDNPGDYLNELLVVGDARYNLGEYEKAGSIYYRSYYAAMHQGSYMNDPKIFPIAHKMAQAWMRSNDQHYINKAHGMCQQNLRMPGHPPYIQNDLNEVEAIMRQKGMKVQRFSF